MSMAKRQQDLKDPGVRKRIEEFLEVKVGDRTVWMKKERDMAEELRDAFERWARKIGFEDFEVKDDNADDLDLEYCDDDVEVAWCAFTRGIVLGGFQGRGVMERSRPIAEDAARAVPEQLRVMVDGEIIVLVAEGEAGTCEVRLKLDEVERFEEALDKARKRVGLRIEKRRSHEAMKVDQVDEEDFEESE